MTENEVALAPVPPGVVAEIVPLVAPLGTCAVMAVDELTTKLGSVAPLNVTLVVPVKPVPWMSTLVPTVPLVSENEPIVGGSGSVTVNEPPLAAVPPGVVTERREALDLPQRRAPRSTRSRPGRLGCAWATASRCS